MLTITGNRMQTHAIMIENECNYSYTIEPLYTEYMDIAQFDDSIDLSDCVLEKLYTICDAISATDASLESKIILAIGIRHRAESFLISEIKKYNGSLYWKQSNTVMSTSDYLSKVYLSKRPQTRALIDAYHQFGQQGIIRIIDEVNIMTPESIHFNSFMYEPLLDMDVSELFNLYRRVQALQT